MNQKIKDIVSKMKSISLEEMDSVKLLNRVDSKYLMNASKLPDILNEISDKYSILYINETPYQDYKTIYFDTNECQMYYAHHNGKSNRYKVRHRTYLSTNSEFLEIKFKTNKGKTFKKRIIFPYSHDLSDANEFLQLNTPFKGTQLFPKSLVEYTRLTLVNLEQGERATIDINVVVTNEVGTKSVDFSHVCIIELKRDSNGNNSIIQAALKKHRIFQKSMSKYSIGTAAVDSELKKNSFMNKLRYIEKLKQK